MIRLTRRARLHIILVVAMAATSACSANPEQVRQQFMDSGDAYVAAGKLPEAIIQYRNAVQQDPQFGAARAKLSEAYLGMGDRVNAAREMVRAADLLPSDPVVQVKAGKMRGLALAADKRSAALPDMPTFQEAGGTRFVSRSWFGFLARAGTPPEIVKVLHDEIARALQSPVVKERLGNAGMETFGTSGEEFAAFMKSESERFAEAIRFSGTKID